MKTEDMDNGQYLKEVSQRVYNINSIIDIHSYPPIKIDKNLMNFYFEEREKLEYTFIKQKDKDRMLSILSNDLISNTQNTYTLKRKIKNAINYLSSLSGDVQAKRNKIKNYNPNTGIEDGPLRRYISQLKTEKGVVEKRSSERNIFNIPKNTPWELIEIRFLGRDDVLISIGGNRYNSNCEVLGFINKKNKKPNKQWEFLTLLSIKEGRINWLNNNQAKIDNLKKIKQKLSEQLKIIFGIDSDPFLSYRAEKAYAIKILLIPENNDENQHAKMANDRWINLDD